MNRIHIWLRAETKNNEYRTPITPTIAKKLLEHGYLITVEKSDTRCFKNEEYKIIGCQLAEPNSWPNALLDAYIIGLKELPKNIEIIKHKHIYFSHSFKNQENSKELIEKFVRGNGKILDLEYLVDDNGMRLTSFGKSAGIAGALLSLMAWIEQKITNNNAYLRELIPFSDTNNIVDSIFNKLATINSQPNILVVGSKGRVGTGVISILDRLNITPTAWTRHDTENKDYSSEILDYDILINCINLDKKINPFITFGTIDDPNRKLTVCVDISCDYLNPHNPLPIYNSATTFSNPVLNLRSTKPYFDIVSIDNLPSLLPVDSSIDFSNQLYPHLLNIEIFGEVWQRADKVFFDKSV